MHSFYKPHLLLTKLYWQHYLKPTDLVIDATCGNGYDTTFLAKLLDKGHLYAFDVQKEAIEKTKERLSKQGLLAKVTLIEKSHENFSEDIADDSIQLIVYNLGYLPNSDKQITTLAATTLVSLAKALLLLKSQGLITITLYPGHLAGRQEKGALLDFCKSLKEKNWRYSHSYWNFPSNCPEVVIIQKN